jgi:hypothetical protein
MPRVFVVRQQGRDTGGTAETHIAALPRPLPRTRRRRYGTVPRSPRSTAATVNIGPTHRSFTVLKEAARLPPPDNGLNVRANVVGRGGTVAAIHRRHIDLTFPIES